MRHFVMFSLCTFLTQASMADDMSKDGMSKNHMTKEQQAMMKDCMSKQPTSMSKADAKQACETKMKSDNMSKMGSSSSAPASSPKP